MASNATSRFVIPEDAGCTRNYSAEFYRLCTNVKPVNHGEFEATVDALIEEVARDESESFSRASLVAIQRCRRGGKTFIFMLSAAYWSAAKGVGFQ